MRVPFLSTAYLFGAIGLFLLAAPWSGVWETFVFPLAPTEWGVWARSGWLRGFVSGLGLLNLFVALGDATRLWRTLDEPPENEPEDRAS